MTHSWIPSWEEQTSAPFVLENRIALADASIEIVAAEVAEAVDVLACVAALARRMLRDRLVDFAHDYDDYGDGYVVVVVVVAGEDDDGWLDVVAGYCSDCLDINVDVMVALCEFENSLTDDVDAIVAERAWAAAAVVEVEMQLLEV